MKSDLNRSDVAVLVAALAAVVAASAPLRADVTRETVEPILRLDLAGHTSEVRAVAFFPGSSRLVSGGRDKVAMIWNPAAERVEAAGTLTRDIGRRRTRERVLRWQAARGTRGAIQAVAVSADPRPLVAVAGSGAMGSTGEILLFDSKDGTLSAVLGGGDRIGHRNSVLSVAFSVGGAWVFSQDFDGQCFAWKRDEAWRPVELAAREEARYGPKRTAAVQARPRTRPLAAVGKGRVAVPMLVSPEGAATEIWRIEIVDPAAPAARQTLPTDHRGVVMAMDASPDGRFLASADLAGRVFLHDLAADPPKMVSFQVAPAAESIAVSPDGSRVAVGVAAGGKSSPRFEVWETASSKRLFERTMPSPVRAVAISDDGRQVAWSGGWQHELFLETLSDLEKGAEPGKDRGRGRLGGVGRRIGRVAFEKQQDGRGSPRRVAIAWEKSPANAGESRPGPRDEFDVAFDLESLAVAEPPAVEDISQPSGRRGTWTIEPAAKQRPGFESWQLSHDGRLAGTIDLELDWQGRLGPVERCVAWLSRPGADEPWAVAVGTDRGIFVYTLDAEAAADGRLAIKRRYRGHEDGVMAVAVSGDGRWLASGGRDGLAMLWPLAGLGGDPLFERFGVGLKVENGRAVVESVDEAGPLAGRDVAVGDVLAKVSAPAGDVGAKGVEAVEGDAVKATLSGCPWKSQWAFFVEREGKADEPFNRQPAWENIAALHLAGNREWAFWSPKGYYAASANGDSLFGWLVNRGLDRLPRFHTARHFRRKLERPDVMSRLLAEGSLTGALRRAGRDLPDSSSRVLPRLIAAAPEVRIVSPEAFQSADGGSLKVRATIEAPPGVEVSDVRAYASGVVAREPAKVLDERRTADGPTARTYEWELDLPAESQQLIQVFAGTREGPTDVGETTVSRGESASRDTARRRRPPRLHLLAAGIDRYRNSAKFASEGLTDLVFAAADATSIRDVLAAEASPFRGLASESLLRNEEVTRKGWTRSLSRLVESISADVMPDDVVVVFLAGHGMNDAVRRRGYAYLCHDASFEEVGGEAVPVEGSTIGWGDFRPLASLPCRKIALVDTCHAGALVPARRAAAVRDFQENMILVLSASADDEASQEADAWGHGAFTKVLLEALGGAADTRGAGGQGGDGLVSVDEVVEHVIAGVPAMTGSGRTGQHPTVSPDGLVPYVTFPLTKRR